MNVHTYYRQNASISRHARKPTSHDVDDCYAIHCIVTPSVVNQLRIAYIQVTGWVCLERNRAKVCEKNTFCARRRQCRIVKRSVLQLHAICVKDCRLESACATKLNTGV